VAVDEEARVRTRRGGVIAIVAIASCAYATLASTTRPNTLPALVAVVMPAAAVTAWVFRHPPAVEPSRRVRRATVLWAAVILAGLLWEAAAFIGEHTVGQYEYPTLSLLTEPALQEPMVRFAAWVAWLLAGWGLVRR
jgi:hypothetical protein